MAIQPFDDKQPITVAVNRSTFPHHFQNDQGQASGQMVDFWSLWAQKQNVELEFIILPDGNTAIEKVANGTIDIHAGLFINQQRQQFLGFSSPILIEDSYIFFQRNITDVNQLSKVMPYTVGVVEKSGHHNTILQLHPEVEVRVYQNNHQMFDAALNGEVLAFAHLAHPDIHYDRLDKLVVEFPSYNKINYHTGQYAAAVAKERTEFLQFIEQGLNKITAEEKSALHKKWHQYNRSDDVLRLVFTPNIPPYMAVSPEGNPQGLFIDIWRLWSKTVKQPVEFIPVNMSEALELIANKGADIHVAYPGTEFVDTGLIPAQNVYSVFSQVYISKDLPNITSLTELNGKTLGVFKTAPYVSEIEESYPEIAVKYFSSYEDMLKAAESKMIDAMAASIEDMNAQLMHWNLQSSFYPLTTRYFTSAISSLVSQDNTQIAKLIEQGFSKISLDELIALERMWLSRAEDGYFYHLKNRVLLSNEETKWLERNQPIKIGIYPSWKPIEFIDEVGNVKGINPDVVRLITERTGIDFSYVKLDGWNGLYNGMLNGDIDILASATQTTERDKLFLFSKPYWDMPSVVVHRQDQGTKLTLKDFYGKSLAMVKNFHVVSYLQKNHPSIVIKLVDDYDEALLALQRGLVDGLVESLPIASEFIDRENLVNLTISVVDEFDNDKNYFAIQKDAPLLKSIIDKAIASISDNDKEAIYQKWFSINVETGYNKMVVMRITAQIGMVLLVIMIVIVVWNSHLRSEIRSRKRLEQQMKHMATHDELTGLANRLLLKDRIVNAINFHQRQKLQMAVLFIDLDGFKNINDNFGHNVGDELLIDVAKKLSNCVRKSDTVVRFGGDEFVLLLTGLHSKDEASFIAEKVLQLLKQPIKLSAVTAKIGCSIGIAMYPNDGEDDIELVKIADTLMYQVKASGKNNYVFTDA